MRTKILNKIGKTIEVYTEGFNAFIRQHRNRHFSDKKPIPIQMKIQIVRKNEVIQRRFIAVKLLFIARFLQSIKVFIPNVLSFNEPNRDFFFSEDIIRRTARLSFGFIGSFNIFSQTFNQLLQITSKSMLGGIASFVTVVNVKNVLF